MRRLLSALLVCLVAFGGSPVARAADPADAAAPGAPPAVEAAPKAIDAARARRDDPQPERIGVGSGVRIAPAGTWSFSTIGFGVWRFSWVPVKGLEAGFSTIPPFGFLGFAPYVRGAGRLDNGFSWSLGTTLAGGLTMFRLPFSDGRAGLFSVSATGAAGWSSADGNAEVSVALDAYFLGGGRLGGSGGSELTFRLLLLDPRVGVAWKVHKNVVLSGEVHAPGVVGLGGKSGSSVDWFRGVFLVYGLRAFGYDENGGIFGDICLALPASSAYFDTVGQIWPLGFPYLTFGMRF